MLHLTPYMTHWPAATITSARQVSHPARRLPARHPTCTAEQHPELASLQVWAVRVDVHILDNCGNMADAAALSALGALLAFRRPDVTVGPGETGDVQAVTVHSPDVREPVPLSIHHLPLAVTFAFFGVRPGGWPAVVSLREVPWRQRLCSSPALGPSLHMHQAHQCGAGGSAGLAGQARAVLDVGDAW